MDKAATLTSLAMLKVNADVANQDYVDYFVPFANYVITRFRPSPITAFDVQRLLRQEFGLALPQHPTEFVLGRLVKRKILRRENYTYILATDTFPTADLDAKRNVVRQQQDALLESVRSFARATAGLEWSLEEAREALLGYMKRFSIECLRSFKQGAPLPAVDEVSDKTLWVLSSFIKSASGKDSPDFVKMVTLVKGHMLVNALMCDDLSSLPRHFGGVHFYIDTPLVLRALGLEGEPRRLAAVEVLELITRLKGQLSAFEHTREEVHQVIRGAEAHLDTPDARGRIIEEARRAGVTRSDLTLLAGRLDDHFRRLGIVTYPTPKYVHAFQIDEKLLEEAISEEVRYWNVRALDYDVNSIRSVYALREGATPRILEDARAVLVTSNSALARAAYDYGRSFESTREVSSVISDFSLANLAWLKAPLAAPELPRLELMAACHAALEPSEALWSKYLVEVEKLEARGGITARDHEVLRYSLRAREELMNLTGGASNEFGPQTVSEILERVKADLVREQTARLAEQARTHEAEKAEWAQREACLQAEQASLEGQRAGFAAARRQTEERLRRFSALLAHVVGRGLLITMAAAVMWHLGEERSKDLLGGVGPWVASALSGLAALGLMLLAVHGLVGLAVKDIVVRTEERLTTQVEKLLRRTFLVSEGERREKAALRGPRDL